MKKYLFLFKNYTMKKILVLICLLFTTLLSNSQCVRTLAGKEIGGDIGNTTGIVIDSLGNSYATTNSVIVKITPSGLVSNFAGILSGFVDGPISIAKFNSLSEVIAPSPPSKVKSMIEYLNPLACPS